MSAIITHEWSDLLAKEKNEDYFQNILQTIQQERKNGQDIYPAQKDIFNAFRYTPLDNLKVVILGQDPYHGPGQAHGLSFSVPKGVNPPPSLQNIFKEIHADLGIPMPKHGCLMDWAKQGVLLLNASLSVKAGQPQSHHYLGWERFTDQVIKDLNALDRPLVFLLWGAYAQKKAQFLNNPRHLILKTTHPSPLSAHRGFLGCKHFSKTNTYLKSHGVEPIDWRLS